MLTATLFEPPTEEATPDNIRARENRAMLVKGAKALGVLALVGGAVYVMYRVTPAGDLAGRRSLRGPAALPKHKKLATASTIARLEKYINEFAFSRGYRVDPETLKITNPHGDPPASWFVARSRGGFMFARKE